MVWIGGRVRRRMRAPLPAYWRGFTLVLFGLAILGAIATALAPELAGLYLLTLYSAPSNSLLPVPHEPALLYLAPYYAPVLIAAAACIGTAVAAWIDYPVVRATFRRTPARGLRERRMFRRAERSLMRHPFATIVLFAATPLPFYVVRVLAPAAGYPMWRYIAATTIGRFPRYAAIAWFGALVPVPSWLLLILFVVLVVALVAGGRSPADRPAAIVAPAGGRCGRD